MVRATAVAVLLALAGCGFHLRGSASSPTPESKVLPGLQSVYVSGPPHSDMVVTMRETLELIGTEVLDQNSKGTPVIAILEQKFNTRMLAVGSDAKVLEKELTLAVRFSFKDAQGRERIEPRKLLVVRDVLADERLATAQLNEEVVLRKEMTRDATRRILRQIRAETS